MGEIVVKDGQLSTEVNSQILFLEKALKDIKEQEKILRDELLVAMTKYRVKKIDNEQLSITYKDASYRERFDTKEFMQMCFEKIDEETYQKLLNIKDEATHISPVAPSLMIKVKQ